MKVNMALISGDDETLQNADIAVEEDVEDVIEEDAEDTDEDDDEDESDSHSKIKAVIIVAIMIGGFVLCAWNMTKLVNNMRLDNQGYPVNVVYEMEKVDDFMGNADGSGSAATAVSQNEDEMSTDEARDGPDAVLDKSEENLSENDGDMAALKKEAEDARNEAALVKQELRNAEDMLDSSLKREQDLQNRLNAAGLE